jgi:thioester reductase-like protein
LFAFLDIKGDIKESYTYGDFEYKSRTIAGHIHSHGNLSPGDRVLLAYPPGLEMIWAFFACVKLGLIPVPVYPPSAQGLEASVQKMNFIARDSGAKAVLTDRSCYWSYKVNASRLQTKVSALQWIVSDDAVPVSSFPFPKVSGELLFLQYTSGSTSDPKGVMVTHANVIENCNSVVDHAPIGVSWLPQYHDMGLIGYYLFFALKGGTTYGFSPADFIQRPALWLEAITRFGATASSAPNFAYEYCLAAGKISENVISSLDLGSLRFLMTAAEPIKPGIYKAFLEKFKPLGLKPLHFFGAYGLAEFTLAVTNYGRTSLLLDAESLKQNNIKILDANDKRPVMELMSCGKVLQNTLLKIVDTSSGNRALEEGAIGEIWLDGPAKCKGYWNRIDLTKDVFEAELSNGIEKTKWLRTGDLGFLYDGELYVCGRIKDLIILRGLNYYPQDIEAIAEQEPELRSGCVVAFADERSGNESLVIVAGLKSTSRIPDARAMQLRIYQQLGIHIFEIVFVPARTISKTSSGKIKRYEIKQKYIAKELQVIAQVKLNNVNGSSDKTGDVTNEELKDLDHDSALLFHRYKLSGSEANALGDAGLDSMKLAEFGHDLKVHLVEKGFDDLSEEVDLKLLQRIAVSELFAMLKELSSASYFARLKFRKAFIGLRSEYEIAETSLMQRDLIMPDHSDVVKALPVENSEEGHCFLTGGTGFFGPFLIHSLLEQTRADVYVLVRADSSQEAMKRLEEAYAAVHPSANALAVFQKRIKPVCGDLSKPKLGMPDADWEFLSRNIYAIYHNGAYVNYLADYEAMRRSNVEGTKEVIRLATSLRSKILNHISTTFIFGWSVKETLFENDRNVGMEFLDFGYSQSKWVSDQLVLNAMAQGLRARIFRPALISPSINGKGYNFDISIRLLAFMLKYGIGTHAQNQVSFTPADMAANNIIAISNLDASLGNTFHVTRDEYSGMHDITELLGALAGKSFTNFDLKSFVPEVISRCQKEDLLFPLLNFLVKSIDHISAMEFKRYDNSNYRKFRSLSPWGKEDPSLHDVVKGIYLFMKNNREISDSWNMQDLINTET